jgi:hypothetical protein
MLAGFITVPLGNLYSNVMDVNFPSLFVCNVELNPCGIALKPYFWKSILSFRFIGFSFTIIQLFAFQNPTIFLQSTRDAVH